LSLNKAKGADNVVQWRSQNEVGVQKDKPAGDILKRKWFAKVHVLFSQTTHV
jgi:hypothetical protein